MAPTRWSVCGGDPGAAEREANVLPSPPPKMPLGGNAPLVKATTDHLEAYVALREPPPFAKKAPVPDDLSLRTRDVKGAGYFLDASQVGICALPETAWIGAPLSGASHAVVVLVAYGDDIDADNAASGWVAGSEHLLATLRAAEIAVCISGQISAMGYLSRAHWTGASEVDLDKLAVLAGLALRDGGRLVNPYLGDRFALAVVTTDYVLNCDAPLHRSARDGRDLHYMLGLSGAVSGLERWRRRRRPSHLGPYPVEDLKRIDRPTTVIFDDEVPRVPSRANFYVRTALGDLSEKTLRESNRWSQKQPRRPGHRPADVGRQAAAGGSDRRRANTR